MSAYIIRRVVQGMLVLLILSFVVFIVMRLLPGDPILIHLGEEGMRNITAEQLHALRVEYGLDKPMMIQYAVWLGDLLHGDLGRSLVYKSEQVSDILSQAHAHKHAFRFFGPCAKQCFRYIGRSYLCGEAREVD